MREFNILAHAPHRSADIKETERVPYRNTPPTALGTPKVEDGGNSSSCLPLIISLMNGLLKSGMRSKLEVDATPIARRRNRGGSVKADRYVWAALSVLFCLLGADVLLDSIRHAGPYADEYVLLGVDPHGAGSSFAVDPLWTVPASPGDGAAYAAWVAPLEKVARHGKSRQSLAYESQRTCTPGNRDLVGHPRRDGCCQNPSTERYFLGHCCLCTKENNRVSSNEGAA